MSQHLAVLLRQKFNKLRMSRAEAATGGRKLTSHTNDEGTAAIR